MVRQVLLLPPPGAGRGKRRAPPAPSATATALLVVPKSMPTPRDAMGAMFVAGVGARGSARRARPPPALGDTLGRGVPHRSLPQGLLGTDQPTRARAGARLRRRRAVPGRGRR